MHCKPLHSKEHRLLVVQQGRFWIIWMIDVFQGHSEVKFLKLIAEEVIGNDQWVLKGTVPVTPSATTSKNLTSEWPWKSLHIFQIKRYGFIRYLYSPFWSASVPCIFWQRFINPQYLQKHKRILLTLKLINICWNLFKASSNKNTRMYKYETKYI